MSGGVIELRELSAGYNGQSVLSGLSMVLSCGEIVSVVGRNGAGKSTLIKTVAGILPAIDGSVAVDGKEISEYKRRDLAKKVAYLSQGKNTPDMTVEQMVLHGRFPYLEYPGKYSGEDKKIAVDAMAKMGLSELRERKISSLSGGMRQNVYIAMALAQSMDYILLDEPTTYLDIGNQLSLMKTLRCLANSGKGIAVVMHDLPLAFSFSDRIAVIDGEKLVCVDVPENICTSGIVERIFGAELAFSDGKYYYDCK